MARRTFNKALLTNTLDQYKKPRKARGLDKGMTHLSTPKLNVLTESDLEKLDFTVHYWKTGDKFFKLAHKFYGDSTLWWVIAWFNQKPTDHHPNIGDEIYIPGPLSRILAILDV